MLQKRSGSAPVWCLLLIAVLFLSSAPAVARDLKAANAATEKQRMAQYNQLLDQADNERKLQNLPVSLALYDRAEKLFPKDTSTFIARADIYKEMGKMDRALAEIEKALRLTPADPRLIQRMGEYSDICGQLEKAIACYDRVLAEKPHDADLLRRKAVALKRLKRPLPAAQFFQKAYEANKTSRDSHMNLHDAGQMYLLANDTSEAMVCFELLIKTNPQLSTGYWDRAQVYDLNNEKTKAALDRAKARKLDLDY